MSDTLRSIVISLVVVASALAMQGCAVDQEKEVAQYRLVLDDNRLPPTNELPANEPLTLEQAMALANRHNEQLGLSGEDYVQALIDKNRAVAKRFDDPIERERYGIKYFFGADDNLFNRRETAEALLGALAEGTTDGGRHRSVGFPGIRPLWRRLHPRPRGGICPHAGMVFHRFAMVIHTIRPGDAPASPSGPRFSRRRSARGLPRSRVGARR